MDRIRHASKFVPRQGTLGAASKPPSHCSGPRNSAVVSMTLVALSRSAVRPAAVRRYSRTPTQLASLPSPVGCDHSSALSPKPLASLPRPVCTSGGASVRHSETGMAGILCVAHRSLRKPALVEEAEHDGGRDRQCRLVGYDALTDYALHRADPLGHWLPPNRGTPSTPCRLYLSAGGGQMSKRINALLIPIT